jgi:hypothetical protein
VGTVVKSRRAPKTLHVCSDTQTCHLDVNCANRQTCTSVREMRFKVNLSVGGSSHELRFRKVRKEILYSPNQHHLEIRREAQGEKPTERSPRRESQGEKPKERSPSFDLYKVLLTYLGMTYRYLCVLCTHMSIFGHRYPKILRMQQTRVDQSYQSRSSSIQSTRVANVIPKSHIKQETNAES